MKKILKLFCLFVALFVIVGCGEDKNPDLTNEYVELTNVGKWQQENNPYITIVFNSDNTGKYNMYGDKDYDMTWVINDNKLTLTIPYGDGEKVEEYEIVINADNTFTISNDLVAFNYIKYDSSSTNEVNNKPSELMGLWISENDNSFGWYLSKDKSGSGPYQDNTIGIYSTWIDWNVTNNEIKIVMKGGSIETYKYSVSSSELKLYRDDNNSVTYVKVTDNYKIDYLND